MESIYSIIGLLSVFLIIGFGCMVAQCVLRGLLVRKIGQAEGRSDISVNVGGFIPVWGDYVLCDVVDAQPIVYLIASIALVTASVLQGFYVVTAITAVSILASILYLIAAMVIWVVLLIAYSKVSVYLGINPILGCLGYLFLGPIMMIVFLVRANSL